MRTIITTWLPILTFCPENNLPDFIYVEVEFTTFVELYAMRKKIRDLVFGKTMYMEDIATLVMQEVKADKVTVRLMFNKHKVIIEGDDNEL